MAFKPFGINFDLKDTLLTIGTSGAYGIFKLATNPTGNGRDIFSDKGKAADEYVKYVMRSPLSFAGSKADALAAISSETDSCAAYVKKKGFLVSGARETCANKISNAWSDVINPLQAEEYINDQKAMRSFITSNKAIIGIAIAAIILLIIIYKS